MRRRWMGDKASVQKNQGENERGLFPKPLSVSFHRSMDNSKVKSLSVNAAFKAKKDLKSLGVREALENKRNNTKRKEYQDRTLVAVKIAEWTDKVLGSFPMIKDKNQRFREDYLNYNGSDKRLRRRCVEGVDELFHEGLIGKVKLKEFKGNVMHKTFYDVLAELKHRGFV